MTSEQLAKKTLGEEWISNEMHILEEKHCHQDDSLGYGAKYGGYEGKQAREPYHPEMNDYNYATSTDSVPPDLIKIVNII